MLNTAQNNRALKDYLYNLQIDIYDTEGLPQSFHNTVKANITFTKKLNDFKQPFILVWKVPTNLTHAALP